MGYACPRKGASTRRPLAASGKTRRFPCTSACRSSGSVTTCPPWECFTRWKFLGRVDEGRSTRRLTDRSSPFPTCSSSTRVLPPQTMPTSSTRSPLRGRSSSGSSSKMRSCAAAASAIRDASVGRWTRASSRSETSTLRIVWAISTKSLQVVRRLLQLGIEVVAQPDQRREPGPVAVQHVAALGLGQLAFDGHVVEVDNRALADDHLVRLLDHLDARLLLRQGGERQQRDQDGSPQHVSSTPVQWDDWHRIPSGQPAARPPVAHRTTAAVPCTGLAASAVLLRRRSIAASWFCASFRWAALGNAVYSLNARSAPSRSPSAFSASAPRFVHAGAHAASSRVASSK